MKLIRDKYRKRRGYTSTFYEIKCRECKSFLCEYQKDGEGILMRLYIDRMDPHLESNYCPYCDNWLGRMYVYEKEKRNALKLFVGSITKHKIGGVL